MPRFVYRVDLPPGDVARRLRRLTEEGFIGSIDEEHFSLQKRRAFLPSIGRIMTGNIESTNNNESIIRIDFRASLWTRMTLLGYFFFSAIMQLIMLPVLFDGINSGRLRLILLSFFPMAVIAIGYLLFKSGVWTNSFSERHFVNAFESSFGDSILERSA